MRGRGRPFTSETAKTRGRPGRVKGQKNRWTKAKLEEMRLYVQAALDRYPGGIEAYLQHLMRSNVPAFMALLRDLVPKPPAQAQADTKIEICWAGDREGADERAAGE